jgi:hypothetical protein
MKQECKIRMFWRGIRKRGRAKGESDEGCVRPKYFI